MTREHPSEKMLAAYLLGKGTKEFRIAIAAHLKVCELCQGQVELLPENQPPPIDAPNRPAAARQNQDIPKKLLEHPQYEVIRELGRGGMGIVYEVKHRITGRLEAIKILMPDLVQRPEIRARFLREIQSAAQLDHPNICRTLTAFEDGELLGLVMEHLDGEDLFRLVKNHGVLNYKLAGDLAIQICHGLDHAAKCGIVHRDIKPGNIILQRTPHQDRIKILDFGLVRGLDDPSSDQGLTQDGRVLGTPEYMSPEQAVSPSTVDIRSDLYSLGCTIYFMLTGRPPFQGETQLAILQAKMSRPAIPVRAINPQIPVHISDIVARLLHPDPACRPATPGALILDLQDALSEIDRSNEPSKVADDELKAIASASAKPLSSSNKKSSARQRNNSGLMSVLVTMLPTVLLGSVLYFYRSEIMRIWSGNAPVNRTSAIVVADLPDDAEIWINNQKATFLRANSSSLASLNILPGDYLLSIRTEGKSIIQQNITVEPGRDFHLTIDPSVIRKLNQSKLGSQNGSPQGMTVQNQSVQSKSSPSIPVGNASTQRGSAENTQARERLPAKKKLSNVELESIVTSTIQGIKTRNVPQSRESLALAIEVDLSEQPEFEAKLRRLKPMVDALAAFNDALQASLKNRTDSELWIIGSDKLAIQKSQDSNEFKVDRVGEGNSFSFDIIPFDIEQHLVDIELDHSLPRGPLAKAIGILTNPAYGSLGLNELNRLLRLVEKEYSPEHIQLLNEIFEISLAEDSSEIWPSSRTINLLRSLKSSKGVVDLMHLLPENVPFPKQTSLIACGKPKGESLATVWNLEKGESTEHASITSPLWSVESSSNGRIFVTLGSAGANTQPFLRVFTPPVAKPVYQMTELDSPKCSIVLSSDGRTLGGCNTDEMFIEWNLQGKNVAHKAVSKQPIGRKEVVATAIRLTMDMVAVASRDGSIRLWQSNDGTEILKWDSNKTPALAIRFNRRGDKLLIFREDGLFEQLDVTEKQIVQSFKSHAAPLRTHCFSTKSRVLATADIYNCVRVWDVDDLSCKVALRPAKDSQISSLAVDSGGNTLAIAYQDSAIDVWRIK